MPCCFPFNTVAPYVMFSSLAHMHQEEVPGFLAVGRQKPHHWTQYLISCTKLSTATVSKMPAILKHDAPSSHTRSPARLCSQSPGELDPGTSQQPFLSALKVRAGIPKQACLKPCSCWDTFQSLEQQVFPPIHSNPHVACSRGGTRAPLPPPRGRTWLHKLPQVPVFSSTPLHKAKKLFSQK